MDAAAVCVTGLLRSVLVPAVSHSFAAHVVHPLQQSRLTVDTFVHAVGHWPIADTPNASRYTSELASAISAAYRTRHVALDSVDPVRYRCPPMQTGRPHPEFHATWVILAQWVTIRKCYARV